MINADDFKMLGEYFRKLGNKECDLYLMVRNQYVRNHVIPQMNPKQAAAKLGLIENTESMMLKLSMLEAEKSELEAEKNKLLQQVSEIKPR